MKKRIFALLLALVMALGLAVTTAAEEPTFGEGWTALTTEHGGTTLTNGNYYLSGDVDISNTITISGTVTLDLNGHVLKLNSSIYGGTGSGSVIKVDSGTFTLQDTTGSAATHYLTRNETTGLYTLSIDPTAISLTGGVITGGTGTETSNPYETYYFGGGVYVDSTATFKMTGGNIVGCTASSCGGGVYVRNRNGNTTNMTGGNIVGCTAEYGGGVYADYSTFTLNGGTIQYCTASDSGSGGVHVIGGNFTMESGSIVGCHSTNDGGGVALESNSTFIMRGDSTIKNCSAKENGGGVHIQKGIFTLENGSIVDCTATSNGAGVYSDDIMANDDETSTMKAQGGSVYGGVYISDNSRCILTNTSTAGSTIFYADTTGNVIVKENGDSGKGKIVGKRVTFMNGTTLYAETVANDGGKISQPTVPTAPEGKAFAGWYTAETDGEKWIFDTGTVSADMTLYARWGCAHTGDWQHDGSGHWKICDTCGEKYAEAAHDGSLCTACGYQKPSGTTTRPTTKPTTETVTSPNTADAGVLISATLSVASLLGMGYVGKKR